MDAKQITEKTVSLKEKQKTKINFLITTKNAEYNFIENIHILRYSKEIKNKGIKPCLIFFIGNSLKPTGNFYFETQESRENAIKHEIDVQRDRLDKKKIKQDARKIFNPTTKAGDIFVSTWGYEQTNVDFYLCQEMKGKTGTFISIGGSSVIGSQYHDSDKVVPDITKQYGEPFKKLVSKCGNDEYIAMKSFEYCCKWDGSEIYRSWGY